MRRLLKWKRLRWFAIGSLIRFVLRRTASRSVDQATADLEERLPGPLRKVLTVVPADTVRAGGSAVVAGRTARRVAGGTRRASQMAGDRRRRFGEGVHRIRSIGDEIGREAEQKRRELKADYLRATGSHGEADDAMLDLRAERAMSDSPLDDGRWGDDSWQDQPWQDRQANNGELPEVKAPIRPGRWRSERRLGTATVNRVQRSYRRPSRPWDR